MENEKQKSMKVKILSLVASLVLCFLLIGVSVYAALTQTLTIDNTITITTSGQTKVAVKVSEYLNKANTAVDASPASIEGWVLKVEKTADENTKEGTVSPINFNYTENVNYYAYKIEFSNETVSGGSNAAAYAHITSSAYDNTQISIWYGTTTTPENTLTNNTAMDTDVTITAGGTATFYVVVAASEALEGLNEKTQTPFNLSITIDQTA